MRAAHMYESVRYYRQITTPSYVATPVATTDAATTAWVAAVIANGGSVSGARQIVVNTLIVSLKADGIFTKLDRLWLFAAENQPSALTDIIATALATETNSPTFTTDVGYTGNASNMFVDSNFNPTTAGSPKYVQNSATNFAWSNTAADLGGFKAICGLGNNRTMILPRAAGSAYWCINGSTANIIVASTNGQGLWSANRSSSSQIDLYRNGSSYDTNAADTSGAPTNTNYLFLGGGVDFPTDGQVSGGGFGQSLNATEQGNLYTHLRTYMTAVGVP